MFKTSVLASNVDMQIYIFNKDRPRQKIEFHNLDE